MTNANPINGVPFGQERTRDEYLARAAWEYEQASKLRSAQKPAGYLALVEGHERAAKAYERAAEGKPSKTTAHATRASDLRVGDAVQFRWEPGTGGVIRSFGTDGARVATKLGERKVPVDALRRVRAEHEARVRSSVDTSTHARIRKTKDVYVVQGNYGYGHGWEDLTAEETRDEAKKRLREYRENEGAPFRLIKRREKIEGSTTHARKKKLDPREAKQRLRAAGIDFSRDFHELRSSDVEKILDIAKEAGYRKSKNAPGSTARMYFQYLDRLK